MRIKATDVLDIIHDTLRYIHVPGVGDVTCNNDSTELTITTDDGDTKTDWVIHAKDITSTERSSD